MGPWKALDGQRLTNGLDSNLTGIFLRTSENGHIQKFYHAKESTIVCPLISSFALKSETSEHLKEIRVGGSVTLLSLPRLNKKRFRWQRVPTSTKPTHVISEQLSHMRSRLSKHEALPAQECVWQALIWKWMQLQALWKLSRLFSCDRVFMSQCAVRRSLDFKICAYLMYCNYGIKNDRMMLFRSKNE